VQLTTMKVKNENDFQLNPQREKNAAKILRTIPVLSLPTLQRLYKKAYEEDASECDDPQLLIRKLQYWFQYQYYKSHNFTTTQSLRRKCREIMSLPIKEESTMGKKGKKTEAAEPEELEEELEGEEEGEELEEEGEEAEEEGEEEEGEESEGEEEGSEEETEEEETPKPKAKPKPEAEAKPKREGVKRTGETHVVKLAGKVYKGKFLYEVLLPIMRDNVKAKLPDARIAKAIRVAWKGTGLNYEDRRVRGERIMYNKGRIKGQDGKVPEKLLKEYDAEKNVVTREIPPQLRDHVKPGQSVRKTIEENKKKKKTKK